MQTSSTRGWTDIVSESAHTSASVSAGEQVEVQALKVQVQVGSCSHRVILGESVWSISIRIFSFYKHTWKTCLLNLKPKAKFVSRDQVDESDDSSRSIPPRRIARTLLNSLATRAPPLPLL